MIHKRLRRPRTALAHQMCNAVSRSEVELLSGLHIKCRVPCVEVAHRGRPELVGGVVVGHHLLSEKSFTRLLYPVLCEAKEELLVTREPVLDRSGLAREGGAVRIVGGGEAGEVSDVLIKRLLAIHGKVGKRFVSVVLRGPTCSRFRMKSRRP